MRMMPSTVLLSVVSALIIAGCSVKENRGECPCRLLLDFSGVDTSVIRSADLLVTAGDGVVFADEVGISSSDAQVQLEVPRAELYMNVYSGISEEPMPGEGVMIPYGEQAPPLYIHSAGVDSRSESVSTKVVMRKEHCVVTLDVNDKEGFPFTLKVTGGICGYDAGGLPVRGEFMCGVEGSAQEGFRVTVPRQLEPSLELHVYDGAVVAKTFALGEYLERIGYDWTKENLDDVTVMLDYSLTYVILTVQGWDEEYAYRVEI